MKSNKFFISFLFILFTSIVSRGEPNSVISASIKGFQEWKTEKMQAVFLQAHSVRNQINRAYLDGNFRLKESLERQLHQLKWNGEVARDLTVADYFSLYLSQQTQADRFQQAAAKLSAQEIAELMEAYSALLGIKKPEVQLTQVAPAEQRKSGAVQIQAAQQK